MKILRIIARLNVGGPARHVVWLAHGMKSAGYDTLLVAGVVPPGEDDMSYAAAAAGIAPLIIPDMRREISLRARAAGHRAHAHGQSRHGRTGRGINVSLAYARDADRKAARMPLCAHVSRPRLS